MDTMTIMPTSREIGNLQRIHPVGDQRRRDNKQDQRRQQPRQPEIAPGELIYTPDGHFEDSEHGQRVDISA